MLLASVGSLTGTLKQLGEQQLAYANANQRMEDGDVIKGEMPLDQMVSAWTSLGGAGGSKGLIDEINRQGHDQHLTAQDLGISNEALFPNLSKYAAQNPGSTWAALFNEQGNYANPAFRLAEKEAGNWLGQSGVTAGSAADRQMGSDLAAKLDAAGLNPKTSGSFGALAKSFATEGAGPFIARAALAGGGLESLLGGAGTLAGDAFLPGALGADGLGAGAAATFGGATGLPAWAGGAADTALGGGIGGTGLGGASLAGEGLTTAGAVGTGFAGGAAGTLGAAGIDAAAAGSGMLSDLPAWAGGAGGTSLGGSTSILDQLKQLVSSNPTSPAGNAASRVLNGTATNEDYLSLAGKAGSSILGYLGAENKANALTSVADKNLALGAPYRGMLAASYDPSFSMSNEPGYKDAIDQSMNSYLRKASTGGNPFSNPGVSTEALKYVTAGTALPAMNTYRSQLGTFGQLGLNTAGTAQIGAAGASGGTYDALGYGLGQLTQPDSTLQDLLKKYASGNSPTLNFAGIT